MSKIEKIEKVEKNEKLELKNDIKKEQLLSLSSLLRDFTDSTEVHFKDMKGIANIEQHATLYKSTVTLMNFINADDKLKAIELTEKKTHARKNKIEDTSDDYDVIQALFIRIKFLDLVHEKKDFDAKTCYEIMEKFKKVHAKIVALGYW